MDFAYNTNFLYEIILKCAQSEFTQSTPSQVKTAHASLGLKANQKKKDDLINDIYRFLSNILVKQGANTQLRDGFPLFNHNNELFQRDSSIKHLVDVCNQKIHIANIHLAQINYNRLNQFKQSLNLNEVQSLCICEKTIDSTTPQELLLKCMNQRCGKLLHRTCFGVGLPPDDYPLFECPDCVLMKNDPLHEVIKTVIPPYLVDNKARQFQLDEMISREIQSNENIGVDVRCIRLEFKSHEQAWPNKGYLELNKNRMLEFVPLVQNTSLKRRRDERFFSHKVNPGLNTIKLQINKSIDYTNPGLSESYVSAVYLVKKLTCEELVQRIKQENRRSVEECKKLIVEEFNHKMNDIDSVTSPLTCVFDYQPLKTPAKGSHCKHANCFSLENFVNLWYRNKQRRWVCPICKVKAYDIIVDSYFEEILEKAQSFNDGKIGSQHVEILKNGDYRFITVEDEMKNVKEEEKTPMEKLTDNKDLIVLDFDSDDEPGEKQQDASNQNAINTTEMNTENGPTVDQVESGAMEEEKESPNMNEEGIASTSNLEKNDIVIHIRETDNHQTNGMAEESIDQDTQNNNIEEEGEAQGATIQESEDKEKPDEEKKSDKMVEETENTGDANKIVTEEEEAKQKDAEVAREKSSEKQKEQSEGKQTKPRKQKQTSPIEQLKQPPTTDEHKLQQQLLQQYQQQQRMQYSLDNLSLPALLGALQTNMQGMGGMLGVFGNNLNPFQQLNPYLMSSLLAKMQQQHQQVNRTSLEDLAALVFGDGSYNNNLNNLAPLLRNFNDLSLLSRMNMNLNGLHQIPGLNVNIQDLYNLASLQQGQANEIPAFNTRSGNSPASNNLSNPVKAQTMSNQTTTPNEEKAKSPIEPTRPMRPVVPRRRENNRPKVFIIEREKPEKRIMNDAEKSLDKLIELSEKKLELPSFGNFKDLEAEDPKKPPESNLQKNKKLVALVMKQFPLSYKTKAVKQTEGQEMIPEQIPEQTNQAQSGQMEIEEKGTEPETEQNQAVIQQGQESDPICLE